jgi:hypothetical protein
MNLPRRFQHSSGLFKMQHFGDWTLSPIREASSIYWVQLCKFHLKMVAESSM